LAAHPQVSLGSKSNAISLPFLMVQQTPAPPPPATLPGDDQAPQQPSAPRGTVLFERKDNPNEEATPQEQEPANAKKTPDAPEGTISDAERSALAFASYDLDVHLVPAKSLLVMHAKFSVRNDGSQPLSRLALQLSSSLHWDSLTLSSTGAKLPFAQHLIDTDADHTGQAQEAIVTLPQPLQPGAVIELSSFYSGSVGLSAVRLHRIGAPSEQALSADWDQIALESTALRGFGNVLWYPTASPPVFLGEGATLFKAVGRAKLANSNATMRLRLTVEYAGEAPKMAYFCGAGEPMTAANDDINQPSSSAPGVALAEFPMRTLGFRVPSLFVTNESARTTGNAGIAAGFSAITAHDEALNIYEGAAAEVKPLLQDWLGDTPLVPLTILDHPGQPFEDGALLVTSLNETDQARIATTLVHSLAHGWFRSSHPWLSEGVAQFMSYLWLEKTSGREVALQQIQEQANTLAFVEPGAAKQGMAAQAGQSLILASDEVYCRTKAAAVLWMLRSIASDAALKEALHLYRKDAKRDENPREFQRVLEQTSHKDLNWFFDDWVYADKGLPDLSIANVTPRELTVRDGRGGWLIAVEVHNSGDAAVEVPVTVRSGTLTATERIRVLGGASASTRILFGGDPEEVVLNDGSIPEVTGSLHIKQLKKQ